MRDSVVFYKSFFECLDELEPERAAVMYRAVFRYAFFDTEPELKGIERGIFQMIKVQIDANNKKYENGKKGGRPRKTEENKPEVTDKRTTGFEDKNHRKKSEKPNVTVKVNENDNLNATENNSSAELKQVSSAPPVISLILNDGTFHDIFQADIDTWTELYPAVDVMQELRKMKGWCNSNPKNRKTRQGIGRFINSWLSRQQDKGGNRKVGENNGAESASTHKFW